MPAIERDKWGRYIKDGVVNPNPPERPAFESVTLRSKCYDGTVIETPDQYANVNTQARIHRRRVLRHLAENDLRRLP